MQNLATTPSTHGNPGYSTLDMFKHTDTSLPSTILLAEDNDDLRCVMECTLRAMGYHVVACADAQLASGAFRSHGKIDALLTDFEMPGRTGVELARELTALCPALPVMIITGSVLSDTVMHEIRAREWTFVSKPCHLGFLATSLKGLLGSRPSAS